MKICKKKSLEPAPLRRYVSYRKVFPGMHFRHNKIISLESGFTLRHREVFKVNPPIAHDAEDPSLGETLMEDIRRFVLSKEPQPQLTSNHQVKIIIVEKTLSTTRLKVHQYTV